LQCRPISYVKPIMQPATSPGLKVGWSRAEGDTEVVRGEEGPFPLRMEEQCAPSAENKEFPFEIACFDAFLSASAVLAI